MSFRICKQNNHALSDWGNLIVKAHEKTDNKQMHQYIHHFCDDIYTLNVKRWDDVVRNPYFDERYCEYESRYYRIVHSKMALEKVVDEFLNCAKTATECDEKPLVAVRLLKDRVSKKYYSGIEGKVARFASRFFKNLEFEKTKVCQKLDEIEQIVVNLPRTLDIKLPSLGKRQDIEEVIFTDDLRNEKAIGALCGYSIPGRYEVRWMSPGYYLSSVDKHFSRHLDEDSMPWITKQMIALSEGKKSVKFAPLMMDESQKSQIKDDYYVMEHEGRHRALAAKKLGVPRVPVAVRVARSRY